MTNQSYEEMRENMVKKQLIPRGISSPTVLKAFRRIERHKFVPTGSLNSSYADHPLPIGEGQTISQPYIVALMTESLGLTGSEKILEVGTGSGYQTAVLAELGSKIYSVERVPALADRAGKTLRESGYKNIEIDVRDGSLGWDEHAPYDAIIVTASCPGRPEALLGQLSSGGRLIAPIGGAFGQALTLYRKHDKTIDKREICGCVFVPLIGKEGWER
ncbi:MAG: protein-L-isoaspartate(D-aspartate) O-methyltransferase [Candidatus Omnitrophica bacterium]|nr:protein-L-isoaspartate(D-aspartate) O-methyltransferase [Candidatus Omnitrophota bacterium]